MYYKFKLNKDKFFILDFKKIFSEVYILTVNINIHLNYKKIKLTAKIKIFYNILIFNPILIKNNFYKTKINPFLNK